MRKTLGVLLTVAFGCLAVALPANAADSLAPPGAPRDWLPKDPWVLEHWLPYDQQRLFGALHVSIQDLRIYFGGPKYQTVPTLASLARSRGVNPRRLARRLVAAWRPHVSKHAYAILLNRATRSLTQGHLMQHMLFHPLHDTAVLLASQQIFGVSPEQLHADLRSGMSRLQIGYQSGRTDQQMISATIAVLRAEQRVGVRHRFTPRSEAREELALQAQAIPAWLAETGTNPQQLLPAGPVGVPASVVAAFDRVTGRRTLASRAGSSGALFYCPM